MPRAAAMRLKLLSSLSLHLLLADFFSSAFKWKKPALYDLIQLSYWTALLKVCYRGEPVVQLHGHSATSYGLETDFASTLKQS